MRRALVVPAMLIALALSTLACGGGADAPVATPAPVQGGPNAGFYGTPVDPPAPVPPFHLTGTDGQPISNEDYEGRVLAVYFGYTHCPDVCPLSLGILKRAAELLTPEEQSQFAVVMVAVDPERDTPEVLARYMPLFDPDFEAATGDPDDVQQVLREWGVSVQRTPLESGGYTVSHPASVFFLDQQGRWALTLDHRESAEHFAEDIRRLITTGGRTAGNAEPAATTTASTDEATGLEGEAVRWFFALADGSVLLREPDGAEHEVLAPWSVLPSEDDLARRQYPGARELAYDSASGMLWYADTHEAIHSVNVDTGERGPTIEGFADAALPGCGVADLSREFALLPGGRLIVPTLLGTTLVYSTDDGSMLAALPPSAFGMPLLGQFRLFVSPAEPDSSTGWFVDALGSLHAFDTTSFALLEGDTGPLPGAPASAFLEAAIDPASGDFVYLTEAGELRAWDGESAETRTVSAPASTRAIAAG